MDSRTCKLLTTLFLSCLLLPLTACDNIGPNEEQRLNNAKSFIDKGELVAASIELRNTLKKNNENAEARYLLGDLGMKVGDFASAEIEFRRAADAGWSKEQVQLKLARIYITKKEYKKLLEKIIINENWSTDTKANIAGLRALAEHGQNNTVAAKRVLNEGKAYDKNAANVLSTTAIFQLNGVLEGDASDTLNTALSLYPDDQEILLIHASNNVQNKHFKLATDTFNKILTLEPTKVTTLFGRRARISLARLYLIDEKYVEASASLAPILKKSNNDPEANFLAGMVAYSQGDFVDAEEHISKLLKIVPDNNQAQQLMGKIKYALKDFNQAAEHLSNSLKAGYENHDTRKLLTNTYLILNQAEHARKTLQPVLSTNPDDTTALSLLSQIEFKSNNTEAGLAALKKAVKTKPENAQLRKQLAKFYIILDQTELAQKELIIYEKLSSDTLGSQKLSIQAYLQNGETERAMEVAKNILLKNPKDANALVLVGSLHARSGNDSQARVHFEKALKNQKGHIPATIELAHLERKKGHLDKAISLLEGLTDANQAGTLPMLELAEIAAQQKRDNDMVSWLEKARNSSVTEIRARIVLAEYYLQKAQPQKALIYTNEAIKHAPEQPDLLTMHSKILLAQKRYSEALPLLNKLLARSPESTINQTLLGEAFLRQQMPDNARKPLQKALAIEPKNYIAKSLLAETELALGHFDDSLKQTRSLQQLQPESYVGYMQEGDVWAAQKNYKLAYTAYDKAWGKQKSAQLAVRLFKASKTTSKLHDAVKPLLAWLKNNPDDTPTRFYLATRYQEAEENNRAIEQYETILKKTPDNSTVLNNLAWLYALNSNPKAMDMAERAYRFSPESPGILDTYGWILVQQNQAEKGLRLIEQAAAIVPESLDIRYHYAVALINTGSKNKGTIILEELLAQDKTFADRNNAKQMLQESP